MWLSNKTCYIVDTNTCFADGRIISVKNIQFPIPYIKISYGLKKTVKTSNTDTSQPDGAFLASFGA